MSNYRHGDVGVIGAASLPKDAVREDTSQGVVLAYGEVTGHAHRIVAGEVEMWTADKLRFMVVGDEGATLNHEEHGPMELEPGIYEVRIQQVFDPFTELSRNVAD